MQINLKYLLFVYTRAALECRLYLFVEFLVSLSLSLSTCLLMKRKSMKWNTQNSYMSFAFTYIHWFLFSLVFSISCSFSSCSFCLSVQHSSLSWKYHRHTLELFLLTHTKLLRNRWNILLHFHLRTLSFAPWYIVSCVVMLHSALLSLVRFLLLSSFAEQNSMRNGECVKRDKYSHQCKMQVKERRKQNESPSGRCTIFTCSTNFASFHLSLHNFHRVSPFSSLVSSLSLSFCFLFSSLLSRSLSRLFRFIVYFLLSVSMYHFALALPVWSLHCLWKHATGRNTLALWVVSGEMQMHSHSTQDEWCSTVTRKRMRLHPTHRVSQTF